MTSGAALRRTYVFLAALLLPVLASMLTAYTLALRPTPFVLNFLAVTFLAARGGLRVSLLGAASAIVSHSIVFALALHRHWFTLTDAIAAVLLFIIAVAASRTLGSLGASQQRLAQVVNELEERNEALMGALQSNKCASWVLDLNSGSSARWFAGGYEVFGRPVAELESLPSLAPLLHPEDQLRLPAFVQHLRTSTEPAVFEHRVPWPDGELHTLECRATRAPVPGLVWRGITVDITERKLAEAALLRSEKLAAMGRLASTVAHEINNPLEAVTNLLYLACADQSLNESTRGYLSLAEKELARLGEITRLTLGFVRSSSKRLDLDVAGIAEDVLSIFRHRLESRNIQVERHLEPGVVILIAPHELRQILTNLISNAADAHCGETPTIAISVRTEVPHGDTSAPGTAVLLLEDNGIGIPDTQLPRIFEPFYTTKQDVGTGIGLWVTRELVEKNQGRISVEGGSLPHGMRTRFRIEFPLSAVCETVPAVVS